MLPPRRKRTKEVSSTEKLLREKLEVRRIMSRNPGKPKNKREKARGLKILVYNRVNRNEIRTLKDQEGILKSMK